MMAGAFECDNRLTRGKSDPLQNVGQPAICVVATIVEGIHIAVLYEAVGQCGDDGIVVVEVDACNGTTPNPRTMCGCGGRNQRGHGLGMVPRHRHAHVCRRHAQGGAPKLDEAEARIMHQFEHLGMRSWCGHAYGELIETKQ